MKKSESFPEIEHQLAQPKVRNPQLVRAIQILSRLVTLIFIAALVWAVYQAFITGNPLSVWAWFGIVILFAVVIGLGVAVLVYRGVAKQAGPFDFRSSNRIVGELKRETHRVEANGAKSLRADIKLTQGVLQLTGGAPEAMQADFIYDDADWKSPEVAYAVNAAGQGELVVEQKATGRPAMKAGQCEWDIRLNGDLPTDLSVKLGAGKSDLRLGDLSLSRLRVENGVGELVVDLGGELRHSVIALIKAGIGDTVLHLPHNAGVRIHSAVKYGSFQQHGLTWDGEAYTNALYGRSAKTLDLNIESGMGKIDIR